ncbi:MAG: hypothetical protein SWH78_14090 [Thermodesulfobacteriota bacterium]|nr:hypothetical protein [Thermodesulfobacteriota bacterium]
MDDFFDDLDTEDYALIGGLIGMFEDEAQEERRRRKRLEEEMLNPDDSFHGEDGNI